MLPWQPLLYLHEKEMFVLVGYFFFIGLKPICVYVHEYNHKHTDTHKWTKQKITYSLRQSLMRQTPLFQL